MNHFAYLVSSQRNQVFLGVHGNGGEKVLCYPRRKEKSHGIVVRAGREQAPGHGLLPYQNSHPVLGDVIVCSLHKIVIRSFRSNGFQGSLDCDEAILFRVGLIGFVHVTGCAIEEGVKSRKKRGEFNKPSPILVEVAQVGRRDLNCFEYRDWQIMLNGISSSRYQTVSAVALPSQ